MGDGSSPVNRIRSAKSLNCHGQETSLLPVRCLVPGSSANPSVTRTNGQRRVRCGLPVTRNCDPPYQEIADDPDSGKAEHFGQRASAFLRPVIGSCPTNPNQQ